MLLPLYLVLPTCSSVSSKRHTFFFLFAFVACLFTLKVVYKQCLIYQSPLILNHIWQRFGSALRMDIVDICSLSSYLHLWLVCLHLDNIIYEYFEVVSLDESLTCIMTCKSAPQITNQLVTQLLTG